jgi:hypothetical protein
VADAGGDAGADAASEAGASLAPLGYSLEGIAPLAPGCRSPHAQLGVAAWDHASLQRRIRQAMAAHPEIEVVAGEPGPHQVKISESQIGTKYFARHPVDHNRYAVNASCGDMDTCLSIAAMVRAAVPDVEPELFCGHPRGLSSDGVPVRGPWTLPDALPDPKDRLAVCARVTACSVRATGAAKDAVGRACAKAPLGDAARCAARASCAEVARCFRDLGAP